MWWDAHINVNDAKVLSMNEDVGGHCDYVAVLTLNDEDGIALLSRSGPYEDPLVGRRLTTRITSRPSVGLGELGQTLMDFNQTLVAPSAVLLSGREADKKRIRDQRFFLWLFQFSFVSAPHQLHQSTNQTLFDQHGRLLLPRHDLSLFPMAANLQNDGIAQRGMFRVMLVGICPLEMGLIPRESFEDRKMSNASESNLVKPKTLSKDKLQSSLRTSKPSFSIQTFTVYSAESLVGGFPDVTLFQRSCILPSYLSSFSETFSKPPVRVVGEMRCCCILKPGNRRPIIPDRFLTLQTPTYGAQSADAVPRRPSSQAIVRGVYIHVARVTDVLLESFMLPAMEQQKPDISAAKYRKLFESLRRSHELRLFWCSNEMWCEQEKENPTVKVLNLNKKFQTASQNRAEKHAVVLKSSQDINFASFGRIPTLSQNDLVPGVDFKFEEAVYMSLPADGSCMLQCQFIIRPQKAETLDDSSIVPSLTLTMKLPLDASRSLPGSPFQVPLVEQEGAQQKFRGLLHLRLTPCPETGVFLKPKMAWSSESSHHLLDPSQTKMDFYTSPQLPLLFTNIYSLLTSRLQRSPPAVEAKPVNDNDFVSAHFFSRNSLKANDQNALIDSCFELSAASSWDGEASRDDTFYPDAGSIVSVTGNPGPQAVTNKTYTMLLAVLDAPSASPSHCSHLKQSVEEDYFFVENITLQLVTEELVDEGVKLNNSRVSCFAGPVNASSDLEWNIDPSAKSDACKVVYRFLRAGTYRLHVLFDGVDITGSPYFVRCSASVPDPHETRMDATTDPERFCLASMSEAWLSSVKHLSHYSVAQVYETLSKHQLGDIPQYYNTIRFQLHDASSAPVRTGGYAFCARALSLDVHVSHVVDCHNGAYEVVYSLTVDPSSAELESLSFDDTSPRLEVLLDGAPVFGSPFRLQPQNLDNLFSYYRKALHILSGLTPVNQVKQELENHEFHAVVRTATQYDQHWESREQEALQLLDRLATALQFQREESVKLTTESQANGNTLFDSKKHFASWDKAEHMLRHLQQRWLYAQRLRFCLESFSKDFSSYQHAQQSIATAVAQYADGLAAAMRRLKGETEALKALQSGPLEMFLKRYEHLSKEQNNELTRDLTTLVKALTEKKFGSIEELKSLQLRLADELRKLHRHDLASQIEQIAVLTVDEIDLQRERSSLEWKAKAIDELDHVLQSRKLNLQFVQNNLKETLRIATVPTETIGVSKAQSSAETASEMLEFTEDSRIQTEDPLSSLDTKLGAMIVYRATGKSPCPAMPEEESLVRQLARGYPMGETLSKWWRPARMSEIIKIKKLLQSCPRIRVAIEEMFCFFAAKPKHKKIEQGKSVLSNFSGITWEAYKRFCTGLCLSSVLLQDVTALHHLFLKFSSEDRSSNFSSKMGFVRVIWASLWPALLRELGYLDTIATLVNAGRVALLASLTRLGSFNCFLSRRFLPFYAELMATEEHTVYRPLLSSPPSRSAEKNGNHQFVAADNGALSSPTRLSFEEMKERVLNAAYRIVSYKKLTAVFHELRTAEKYPVTKTEAVGDGSKSDISQENLTTISVNRLLLYLSVIGFCPAYASLISCSTILQNLIQQCRKSGLSGNITLELFVGIICLLLAFTAQETLQEITENHYVNPNAQLEAVYLRLSDTAVIFDWGK